jgi:hypothetical protein
MATTPTNPPKAVYIYDVLEVDREKLDKAFHEIDHPDPIAKNFKGGRTRGISDANLRYYMHASHKRIEKLIKEFLDRHRDEAPSSSCFWPSCIVLIPREDPNNDQMQLSPEVRLVNAIGLASTFGYLGTDVIFPTHSTGNPEKPSNLLDALAARFSDLPLAEDRFANLADNLWDKKTICYRKPSFEDIVHVLERKPGIFVGLHSADSCAVERAVRITHQMWVEGEGPHIIFFVAGPCAEDVQKALDVEYWESGYIRGEKTVD